MPTIFRSGTEVVGTGGNEYGIVTVKCTGLQPSFQILATARPSGGGIDPIKLGPLYVAFVKRNDPQQPGDHTSKPTPPANNFDILVYDIQGAKHNVDITVDWAVIEP